MFITFGNTVINRSVCWLVAKVAWVGGSDAAVEGTWTWSDGSPWDYLNWLPGDWDGEGPNPNNAGGVQDCTTMNWFPAAFPFAGYWDDDNCALTKTAYVCKRTP